MQIENKLRTIFQSIYKDSHNEILEKFIDELKFSKKTNKQNLLKAEWHKEAIIYSLYVDFFNINFEGLTQKLDYFTNLGVNCLWLLPILESPGMDAGFDISDFKKIRSNLFSNKEESTGFNKFLQNAHQKGINIIFDIAINHTSNQHQWFLESKKSINNTYRDYYIWNKTSEKYLEAKIIFEGIETSNWTKYEEEYYFHRFFDFQPDLNYKNPKVLIEMTLNLVYWLNKGVDGFRLDAIPYLWKEENTNCENLPNTHNIIKFFRAVIDSIQPNTLLLAEACQNPTEIVKYFGNNDECNAGYHFPLISQIFKAITFGISKPILEILSEKITPQIPQQCQWFTLLRCHDELSFDEIYINENDRKYMYEIFCKSPQWDFKNGQGISSRIAPLLDNSVDKIALVYSIMLTLPGSPIIYYGDEFGKQNDEEYYKKQSKITNKNDSRNLVRGYINWKEVENELQNKESFSAKIYSLISEMLKNRLKHKAFGLGDICWENDFINNEQILIYSRKYNENSILVIQNLSEEMEINIKTPVSNIILSNNACFNVDKKILTLKKYGYIWFVKL